MSRLRCIVRILLCLSLLCVQLLCVACGNPALVRRLSDQRFPARPDYYPILLTAGNVEKPYEVVAEVTTRPYDARILEEAGNAELRSLARKFGGDAVIKIVRKDDVREEFGYRPGALFRLGTRFENVSMYEGLVVRFTGNP